MGVVKVKSQICNYPMKSSDLFCKHGSILLSLTVEMWKSGVYDIFGLLSSERCRQLGGGGINYADWTDCTGEMTSDPNILTKPESVNLKEQPHIPCLLENRNSKIFMLKSGIYQWSHFISDVTLRASTWSITSRRRFNHNDFFWTFRCWSRCGHTLESTRRIYWKPPWSQQYKTAYPTHSNPSNSRQ